VRNGSNTTRFPGYRLLANHRRRLFESGVDDAFVRSTVNLFTDLNPQWAGVLRRLPGYDAVTFAEEAGRAYPSIPTTY